MTTEQTADRALPPELEAIAQAARDRLHAQAGQDLSAEQTAQQRVAATASAAISAGAALSAIADAERVGETRGRQDLGHDVLRHLARAARRKRDADSEYEEAVRRVGRIGRLWFSTRQPVSSMPEVFMYGFPGTQLARRPGVTARAPRTLVSLTRSWFGAR